MIGSKILFIIEENVLQGQAEFGYSNDALFIWQALNLGLEVFLTTPEQILKSANDSQNFPAFKLENLNPDATFSQIIQSFSKEIINAVLAIKDLSQKKGSKILFENLTPQKINLKEVKIFNRAEPISLSDEFYQVLINWQQAGIKILPNPFFNHILGDKLAIYGINHNLPIDGIDLLEKVDFKKGENAISFKTKIIKVQRGEFLKAAKEYLDFHQELGNDSIIKPLNYFGGTGVVVAKNQQLNLKSAAKNIAKSFMAIRKDCQKHGVKFLSKFREIIVQERAHFANAGDLRIIFSFGKLQDIFVRINPQFEKVGVNSLRLGGHIESLFKHYEMSKEGADAMIKDGGDGEVLKQLLEVINFLSKIPLLKNYPIIGADALLTQDENGALKYAINEINVTSPMGQNQSLVLKIVVKLSLKIVEILNDNDFEITLKKYQLVSDYFKKAGEEETRQAKEILLQNEQLQELIADEIEELLKDELAKQTIKNF